MWGALLSFLFITAPARADMLYVGLNDTPGEVDAFETMLDFDEKFAVWRSVHMLMVARTIGMKPGTGGSAGYKVLESRAPFRFFPELWNVRTLLGTGY